MSMHEKIKRIRDILLTVSKDVYHYEAMKKKNSYIVYAEDTEGQRISAGNRKIEQVIQGTIDYFTKKDWDTKVDEIQDALNDACISFYLNSVQFEEETGYMHYEWVWEVA